MQKALIIAGPTAIGKTSLALRIARQYGLPIISADSRQVYHELNIGVAKPSAEELNTIQHIGINCATIHQSFNVGFFNNIVSNYLCNYKGNFIITGGTGLYTQTLLQGIDNMPKRNDELRALLQNILINEGLCALQKIYFQIKNPYPLKDINNPQRVMRAIEIGEMSNIEKGKPVLSNVLSKMLVLETPRKILYENIDNRVMQMVANGLKQEVQDLLPYQHLESLKTVGYREYFDFFNNLISEQEAIENIKQHTRNYAKRQLTYFKNKFDATWIDNQESKKIDIFVAKFISHDI